MNFFNFDLVKDQLFIDKICDYENPLKTQIKINEMKRIKKKQELKKKKKKERKSSKLELMEEKPSNLSREERLIQR